MPGAYLGGILLSLAAVALCDFRWRLALWWRPRHTAVLLGVGWVFLLLWDLVGISTGVFVKGGGGWFIGIDLFPHMPLEEPFFLLFLVYLTLVLLGAFTRFVPTRRAEDGEPK